MSLPFPASRSFKPKSPPGHEDINGNERADTLAKSASSGFSSLTKDLPSFLRRKPLPVSGSPTKQFSKKTMKIRRESECKTSQRYANSTKIDSLLPSDRFLHTYHRSTAMKPNEPPHTTQDGTYRTNQTSPAGGLLMTKKIRSTAAVEGRMTMTDEPRQLCQQLFGDLPESKPPRLAMTGFTLLLLQNRSVEAGERLNAERVQGSSLTLFSSPGTTQS